MWSHTRIVYMALFLFWFVYPRTSSCWYAWHDARALTHTYSTSQIQRTERDRCFTNNSGTRLWKCTSNNDRDAKRTFSYRVKLPRTTCTAKTSRQINFTIFHQQRKLADNSFALTRAHAAHRTARSCFLEFNWRFIIKICVHATGHIYSRSHARAECVYRSLPVQPSQIFIIREK